MPVVFIPTLLQSASGGLKQIEVEGSTVREVIENLPSALRERLLEGGLLRSNVVVAVDGEVSVMGLPEKVEAASEVHFVTAIKGGYW